MKAALCVLSYKRYDLTAQTVAHNITNCGHDDIGLFVEDTFGIAKASNNVLRRAYLDGYDFFVLLGNDILMPDGWLSDYIQHANHLSGMISYPINEIRTQVSYEMVVGCFGITRRVVDAVGAFDERFDPYGAIDLDYNKRCTEKGFMNFYLPFKCAKEIDHNDGSLYGFNKPELVNKTWGLHTGETLGHIPLIELKQMSEI